MAPISRSRARRARDKPSRPNKLVTASQIPYSPPMTRARRAWYASSSDRLPAEVLSAILQRFPAKDLCRLRTVCRSWRSIISNPDFIRQHKESHKEPLFVVTFPYDKKHVYVMDLNGKRVKRITVPEGGLKVLRTRLDLACLASTESNKCRLLNPATGGIPQVVLPPIGNSRVQGTVSTFLAFGLVASGEYKLLCCLMAFNHHIGWGQHCAGVQVLTINGGIDTEHAQWRRRPDPPVSIDVRSRVVVDGVVYFMTGQNYILDDYLLDGVPADYIVPFDLEREEWSGILHGPSGPMGCTGNLTSGPMVRSELTLADLKGSLVLAHHPFSLLIMDLWFLLDFDSRLWVKQYSIRTESITRSLERYQIIPLLALDDGRLVINVVAPYAYGRLFICDPGTNTSREVNSRDQVDSVGVFTGNLLSL